MLNALMAGSYSRPSTPMLLPARHPLHKALALAFLVSVPWGPHASTCGEPQTWTGQRLPPT